MTCFRSLALAYNRHKTSGETHGWIVFLFWVGLGLATSVPGLFTRTPYYDEVFETRMALLPIPDQILLYTTPERTRTSPPLYHLLLHPVLALFGTTPFVVRSLAWSAGAINVALTYFLLKRLFVSPWPALGTLGFMLSSWHIALSQTARQHGLFVTFVLLGLILFMRAEKTGKGFIYYCLTLAAACHTQYWGLLVVLPAHFLATLMMRRHLNYWRRAVIAQMVAGLGTVPYVLPILRGYNLVTGGGSASPPLTVPYFGTILVNFAAATSGQFELFDLPWVAVVTVLVSGVIAIGAIHWGQKRECLPQWLGLCFAVCFILLFLGYLAGASHMAWAPLLRKLAILQIPLLVSFLYGISNISRRVFKYGLFFVWATTAGAFGLRFMGSDLYKSSQLIADQIAQFPTPMVTFLNFDTSLPADKGSLAFLLERMKASEGRTLRFFDFRSTAYPDHSENRTICFSYMREGGYLQARLRKILWPSASVNPRDTDLNHTMQEIISRFQNAGWRTLITQYYPGRISYQLACFQQDRGFSQATPQNDS
jgi:hypothetical protein